MAVVLDIKVITCASKTTCLLNKTGIIVCYVKNPPERGLANKELIAYIAKTAYIAQQDIHIIAGLTSRKKRLKIETSMSKEELLQLLGIGNNEQLSLTFK